MKNKKNKSKTTAPEGSKENPLHPNLVSVSEFAEIKNVRTATVYNHINNEHKELTATYIGLNASVTMIDLDMYKDYTFSTPKFKFKD